MESVWDKTAEKPNFSELCGDKSVDVLVIGGGMAGILCAHKLKDAGADVMLAEADIICGGITKNTTAKVTLGHGLVYGKMIRRLGIEMAQKYVDAQIGAIKEYARLCERIDCDWERRDNYVYSLKDREKIEREVSALRDLGVNAEFTQRCELPFPIVGAVRVEGGAQLHPLKFLYSVARDLPIYEHTKIKELMQSKAVTKNGTITYKKLIIATHFPILNKHGLYPLKLYQHRSYVIALRGVAGFKGMYVDEANTGLSFRSYKDILLLGGGGHRTGKKGGCWQELEDFAKKHYKNFEIVGKWATQDCMTLDGIPYIGQYAPSAPDVFVVTGFNKWGMTNSMAAANIISDLVRGKESPFADVFSPSRMIFHPQLAVNAFESLIGLLTPAAPRCPHLGCALIYNSAEHSWDCPCHGSRFSETGELIDNPATDDHPTIKG